MPLYFFQLSFGSRVVPDEEGVELRDRAAAREEAHAIIGELTNRTESNGRRWASWFLEVNDEAGRFLRLPVGQPALELVANNASSQSPSGLPEERPHRREKLKSPRPATPATSGHPLPRLVRQIAARREQIAQLLDLNRELRQELSSQHLRSREICGASRQVISRAQSASVQALPPPGSTLTG